MLRSPKIFKVFRFKVLQLSRKGAKQWEKLGSTKNNGTAAIYTHTHTHTTPSHTLSHLHITINTPFNSPTHNTLTHTITPLNYPTHNTLTHTITPLNYPTHNTLTHTIISLNSTTHNTLTQQHTFKL
jgi:hypothetical protein